MKLAFALFAPVALQALPCEELVARWTGVHADLHDGDEKSLTIKRHTLHIKPHGNNQTWEIKAKVDSDSCLATVNFDVPGKPDHPPVPLLAEFLHMNAYSGRQPGGIMKVAVEFTDPSSTLKAAGYPLNHWVNVEQTQDEELVPCPSALDAVFADLHDGDEKRIVLAGDDLTVTSNSDETWVVHSKLDRDLCKATIDFNVPGKPSPPPVNLTATLWQAGALNSFAAKKTVVEFTDPTGTLAEAAYPLNHWVQLPDGFDPYKPPVAKGKCCYGFPGSDNWQGCQSATACPANPSCESQDLCEGICRGAWCNTEGEDLVV
jgi:hypothetical protein